MDNLWIIYGYIWIWLVVPNPLKNMKVNWDDYSKYVETYIIFQTTNQFG